MLGINNKTPKASVSFAARFVQLTRWFSTQTKVSAESGSETVKTDNHIVCNTLNISPNIMSLRERKLHQNNKNPIGIIKHEIESHFAKEYNGIFSTYDNLNEKVTVKQNFEDLLIPKDHPSRNLSDTYYFNNEYILRPQTSAHQTQLLRKYAKDRNDKDKAFLVTGDCYRKDTIDSTHYPVFHQMEGVRIWHKSETTLEDVDKDLHDTLERLVTFLFPNREFRWLNDYFPFTDPSYEMEVKMDDDWLEVECFCLIFDLLVFYALISKLVILFACI